MPRRKPHDPHPWTASRCVRLLRPITSRLEPLRKIHASRLRAAQQASTERAPPAAPDADTYESDRDASGTDPIWLPRDTSGASCRTYSGRLKRKRARSPEHEHEHGDGDAASSTPAVAHSEFDALPTPFRVLAEATPRTGSRKDHAVLVASSSPVTPFAGPVRGAGRGLYVSRGNGGEGKQIDLEKGLLDAVVVLLERTAAGVMGESGAVGRGAASLQVTCLRKLPGFITNEHLWAQCDDPDDGSDMTAEIYAAVEALRPADSQAGYEGLRIACRSHGLQMLETLAKEGILSIGAMARICDVVFGYCTRSERETLLVAILTLRNPETVLDDIQPARLLELCCKHIRHASVVAWARLVDVAGLDWTWLAVTSERQLRTRMRRSCRAVDYRLAAFSRIVSATVMPITSGPVTQISNATAVRSVSVQSFPWPSTMIVAALLGSSRSIRHSLHQVATAIRSQLTCMVFDAIDTGSESLRRQTSQRQFHDRVLLGALAIQCAYPSDIHAAIPSDTIIQRISTPSEGFSATRHVKYLMRLIDMIIPVTPSQDQLRKYRLHQIVLPSLARLLMETSRISNPVKLLGQACLHHAKSWAKNDPRLEARRLAHSTLR